MRRLLNIISCVALVFGVNSAHAELVAMGDASLTNAIGQVGVTIDVASTNVETGSFIPEQFRARLSNNIVGLINNTNVSIDERAIDLSSSEAVGIIGPGFSGGYRSSISEMYQDGISELWDDGIAVNVSDFELVAKNEGDYQYAPVALSVAIQMASEGDYQYGPIAHAYEPIQVSLEGEYQYKQVEMDSINKAFSTNTQGGGYPSNLAVEVKADLETLLIGDVNIQGLMIGDSRPSMESSVAAMAIYGH